MSFFTPTINHSGGWGYHYRAWRYRTEFWSCYRNNLNEFLFSLINRYQSSNHLIPENLILFGPSGGYTLPTPWLRQFKKIWAIDPDPWAPFLFHCVHGHLPIIWNNKSFFYSHAHQWNIQPLLKFKKNHKNDLWFFTHLIGQLPLMIKSPALEKTSAWFQWQADWHDLLSGLSWISSHDLFSISTSHNYPRSLKISSKVIHHLSQIKPHKDKEHLLVTIKEILEEERTPKNLPSFHLCDHLTFQLLPESQQKSWYLWELCPQQLHFMEVLSSI